MFVELTEVVVTGKFADMALAGTVTDTGAFAAGFALDKFTEAPPVGAAAVKFTVPVADCPPITADGFKLTELKAAALTVGL
jgi:hypothetical protein